MNNTKRYSKIISYTLVICSYFYALTSCDKITINPSPIKDPNAISYSASVAVIGVEEGSITRASIRQSRVNMGKCGNIDVRVECSITPMGSEGTKGSHVTTDNIADLGVFGYKTTGDWTTEATSAFIPNHKKTKNGSNWDDVLGEAKSWPDPTSPSPNIKVSFFAYSPYTNESNGLAAVAIQTGNPAITYTLPTVVANQPDFIYATLLNQKQTTSPPEKVSFTFSHALASVGFEVVNGGVQSIGLKGIYKSGDFNIGTAKWSNQVTSTTVYYTQVVYNPVTGSSSTGNYGTSNKNMMLIPQNTDNIYVVLKLTSFPYQFEIPLKTNPSLWEKGQHYHYTISIPPLYIDEGISLGEGIRINLGNQTTPKWRVFAPVNCGYEDAPISLGYNGYLYGKLYQWGRKWGHGYRANNSGDATMPVLTAGPVSKEDGQNPINKNVFYYNASDWCSTQIDNLWNIGTGDEPTKTSNDPCPDGWRVPTFAELNSLLTLTKTWVTNGVHGNKTELSGYNFTDDSSPPKTLFLPTAGWLNHNDGTASLNRDTDGAYWASRGNNTSYSDYLKFNNGSVTIPDNGYRASGYSIRCVRELYSIKGTNDDFIDTGDKTW